MIQKVKNSIKNACWLLRTRGLRSDVDQAQNKINEVNDQLTFLNHHLYKDMFKDFFGHFSAIKEFTAETINGKFILSVHDNIPKGVTHTIAKTGLWEPTEIEIIKNVVREGDLVIDVGANIGWHTVAAARRVGDSGHVVSLEPDDYNYSLMKRNVEINGFAETCSLMKYAASDKKQTVEFEMSDFNYGDHRVRYQDSGDSKGYWKESERKTIKLDAIALDELFESEIVGDKVNKIFQEKGVRLLKVDTQGSEYRVTKGAKKVLDKTDYLILEFWPYGLKRAGDSSEELLKELFLIFKNAQFIHAPWHLDEEDLKVKYSYEEIQKLKEKITMADNFDLLFSK